jgi:Tol biopolymer transport system component
MQLSLLFLAFAWCSATIVAAEPPRLITFGGTNTVAAGDSLLSAMTPDARYIVFASDAGNLTAHDGGRQHTDIFVYDAQTRQTTLVSINASGTGGGDDDSAYASISADGRYVVFASAAENLVANDTNGVSDVFRRDLQLGTTELVSVALSGGVVPPSKGRRLLGASNPVMTPDGGYVAFESASTNLIAVDTNQTEKVFVRDMQSGTTALASGDRHDRQTAWSASLSSNATYIAFVAKPVSESPLSEYVFVRDLRTNPIYYVGVGSFTGEFNRSFAPVLSPNGGFVVFKAVPSAGSPVHLVQYDVGNWPPFRLATNSHLSTAPSLSADGRWLGFEENGHVYLRDMENKTNILISSSGAAAPPARGTSHAPVVSGDGRHVVFVSSATNLVPGISIGTTNTYHIYVRDVSAGVTRLVTVTTNGRPASISAAAQPLISHDGSRIAFDTDIATLVPGDNNKAFDVFLRDMESGVTTLISAEHPQRRALTGIRSATLKPNSVSADGRRVAFAMLDNIAIAGDTNRHVDVFVHDMSSGALLPQSAGSNGVFLTTRRAFQPFLSGEGQHVIFETSEPGGELYSGQRRLFWRRVDSGPAIEILNPFGTINEPMRLEWAAAINHDGTLVAAGRYLHDMTTGTRQPLNTPFTQGFTIMKPLFSPNEEWLAGKYGPGVAYIYAVHLHTNKTVLVSKDLNGQGVQAVGGVFNGSGRYFVFDAVSGSTNEVYRYDFESDATQLISTNGTESAVDYAGDLIAFSSANPPRQIYVRNVSSGSADLITRNAFGTGPASGDSRSPLISGDGRWIVFVSSASDLVSGDNNKADDIFVHDRVQRTTMLLTRSRAGHGAANALSSVPVLAADGRNVVFQSFASDLVEGDYNEERDIFTLRLGVGDSDNDGMDDDWEVAHFGNLNRDGAGDQDDDGQTDLQEFLAGTNPTNSSSILRVLTITRMGGGGTTVVWSAVVGRDYVVQFKDSLDATWTDASGSIEADSTSMSFTQESSSPQRFYRVIALQ